MCALVQIGTRAVAEEADVVPSGVQNQLMNLEVEVDNDSDPDATIIKVPELPQKSNGMPCTCKGSGAAGAAAVRKSSSRAPAVLLDKRLGPLRCQVSGQDKSDLLLALTGVFNSLDLRVCSANIASNEDGRVRDVFRITDMQDEKAGAVALAGRPPIHAGRWRSFVPALNHAFHAHAQWQRE